MTAEVFASGNEAGLEDQIASLAPKVHWENNYEMYFEEREVHVRLYGGDSTSRANYASEIQNGISGSIGKDVNNADPNTNTDVKKYRTDWMKCLDDTIEFDFGLLGVSSLASDATIQKNLIYAMNIFMAGEIPEKMTKATEVAMAQADAFDFKCTPGQHGEDICSQIFENGEFPGGDTIRDKFPVEDFEECMRACHKNTQCLTWYIDFNKYCFLKNDANEVSGTAHSTGGINILRLYENFFPMKEGMANHNKYSRSYGSAASWQECQQQCRDLKEGDDRCTTWNYNKDGRCRLQTTMREYRSKDNADWTTGLMYLGESGPHVDEIVKYQQALVDSAQLSAFVFDDYRTQIKNLGFYRSPDAGQMSGAAPPPPMDVGSFGRPDGSLPNAGLLTPADAYADNSGGKDKPSDDAKGHESEEKHEDPPPAAEGISTSMLIIIIASSAVGLCILLVVAYFMCFQSVYKHVDEENSTGTYRPPSSEL